VRHIYQIPRLVMLGVTLLPPEILTSSLTGETAAVTAAQQVTMATQLTTKMTLTTDTRMTTMMMLVTMVKWSGPRLERMNMYHKPTAATRRGCRPGNNPSCAA